MCHNDDKKLLIKFIPPCNDEQQNNINIPLTMNQYVLYP